MPKKSRGLARGLDALLPEMDATAPGAGQEIAIGDIDPNPDQPRHMFTEESIQQLAQSIRDQGILQPILVTPVKGGRYRIVAGERRFDRVSLFGNERYLGGLGAKHYDRNDFSCVIFILDLVFLWNLELRHDMYLLHRGVDRTARFYVASPCALVKQASESESEFRVRYEIFG